MFNPYLSPYLYPPIIPGKPYLFPPLTPSDILLNRFAKAAATASDTSKSVSPNPSDPPPNPALVASYFKTKKDEFLTKLFEKISATTESPDIFVRAAAVEPEDPNLNATAKPPVVVDPSYFLSKKFDFLSKLFKALNSTTPTPPVENVTDDSETASTTLKPTIVPPNFWFPFPKPPKPPKPSKAPKPPKAKKVLKDALDAMLLQSLLADMGVDPTDASLTKRASIAAAASKKTKPKKVKPFEEEITEYTIPEKVDPEFYSSKASSFLDKLFKSLNKSDGEELTNYVTPKATVIPLNFWTKPSDKEYTSKLDAFLDLLIKSLNATDGASTTPKPAKSKISSKKFKRASFLDEFLHRIPPSTTTTEKPAEGCDCKSDSDCGCKSDSGCNCKSDSPDCCCDGKCDGAAKSERSLIFKPFGSGYWIPQYLYAAKMGLYLDKLMDTINTAAADDISDSPTLKRSAPTDSPDDALANLPPKDAAVNLIISELTELKDGIIEAFAEGLKAQKLAATPKPKPSFGPAAKSFKKPTFWGAKPSPTPDPVEQIQKRIDLINDVFDKLTKVEKTLLFSDDPDDPKTIKNITQLLKAEEPTEPTPKSKKAKPTIVPADFWAPDPTATEEDPNYYLTKTQEFLKTLYQSKLNDLSDGEE